MIQPPVFPTTSIITSPTPSAQEKRSGRASTLPQAYARTSFPGAESTTISRSSYTAPPVTSPPTSPGRLRFSLPQLDEESRAVTPTSSPEKTFRSSLRCIDRPTESAPLPPPSGSAGSNTIQRSSQRRTLASQSTVPPVPPRQRSIATSGRISTPTAPTTTVTHPSREQTVHVTFSSTGPPISSCYANYTIVRQANTTGTSTATRTTMSARDSSVPQHHSRQRSASAKHSDALSGQINSLQDSHFNVSFQENSLDKWKSATSRQNVGLDPILESGIHNNDTESDEERSSSTGSDIVFINSYVTPDNASTVTLKGSRLRLRRHNKK